jgi:hypothetical protein
MGANVSFLSRKYEVFPDRTLGTAPATPLQRAARGGTLPSAISFAKISCIFAR